MKLIRVGVDLAKNVFQLHGVDRAEKAMPIVVMDPVRQNFGTLARCLEGEAVGPLA
jgi:hypothetical protein